MRTKIALIIVKLSVHDYLSHGCLNPLSKLNSEKVAKSAYLKHWFDNPCMRFKIAPNLIKIGFHAYLSNGYLNPLSKLDFDKD